MDDRELLELAAKAAGIQFHAYVDDEVFGTGINIGDVDVPLWNPLIDDGDALRLAVRLRMKLITFSAFGTTRFLASARLPYEQGYAEINEHGDDELPTTRRAIVRAAAAIGKDMPHG